jgi:hypothetical protein
MREKLNGNPVAQIALIAVLVLVGGYLLLSTMGGGESAGSGAGESSEVESAEQVAATSAVSAPAGNKLPHAIEAAHGRGDTIALLIYRKGGIDDAAVAADAAVLQTMPDVAFFYAPTTKIARYSAITGPVGVNRAPALVVVRAGKKGDAEPAPATVTYGYLGPEEVEQAVIDARYTGPEPSYAPN